MEINGIEYRICALDPFKQLHIARRIAPLLAETVKAASASDEATDMFDMDLGPVAKVLAGMSDEDVDYITKTCLRAVKRIEQGQPMNVINASDGLQYHDLGLMGMMQLVMAVLRENLGDFFSTGQSILNPAKS